MAVFITGGKTLSPIVSGRVAQCASEEETPAILREKSVILQAYAKSACGAEIAAQRQRGYLANLIGRIGAIHTDDGGADAQPQFRGIKWPGHYSPVDAFGGIVSIAIPHLL